MGFSTAFETIEPSRDEIDATSGPLVVEFGTPWCGYCKAALPLIAAAFQDFPQVRHLKIEDGRGRRLGRSYRVKLWPTLVFLSSGKEIARVIRPEDSKSIANALAQIANGHDDTEASAVRGSD